MDITAHPVVDAVTRCVARFGDNEFWCYELGDDDLYHAFYSSTSALQRSENLDYISAIIRMRHNTPSMWGDFQGADYVDPVRAETRRELESMSHADLVVRAMQQQEQIDELRSELYNADRAAEMWQDMATLREEHPEAGIDLTQSGVVVAIVEPADPYTLDLFGEAA